MHILLKLKKKYFKRIYKHRSVITRRSIVAVLLKNQKLSRAFIGEVRRANRRSTRISLSFKIKQIGISKNFNLNSPLVFKLVRLR